MANSAEMQAIIDTVRNNPPAMQRVWLKNLEDSTNGVVRIVDPTNPFVFLLEASCVNSATALTRNEALTRRIYPRLATTDEDLYTHMADSDFLNRFVTPSQATFTVLMVVDDIKQRAVPVGTTGVKKLTIPRHTEFSAGDTAFTMQYPIEIRLMPHGGFIVNYDVEQKSPLYQLNTNAVDWFLTTFNGVQYMRINIPVKQFKITSYTASLNAVTGYAKTFSFTDSFFYCRAYNRVGNRWVEIHTTHTDQVYDPLKPTVVLKVLPARLSVYIPQIYFNNGALKDSVRIDIYTSKGPLNLNLGNFKTDTFKAVWTDLDSVNQSLYTARLNTFPGLAILSDDVTTGGAAALSFEEFRSRVVDRSLSNVTVPITPAQVDTAFEDLGYGLVKNVDNVTNRQLLATRSVEPPQDLETYTGISCAIKTIQKSMTTLAALPTVENNGSRITILPTTVYREIDGVISIVDNADVTNWQNAAVTSPEQLSTIINGNRFLYSPYHYVLDINNDQFDVRPYQLDKPELVSKFFIGDNERSNIEAVVSNQEFVHTANGYELYIQLKATETLMAMTTSNIQLQLSYVPKDTNVRVFFQGTLSVPIDIGTGRPKDDLYIYLFQINSNFDVDVKNQLMLTDTGTLVDLETVFDLVVIGLDNTAPRTDIDDLIDDTAFPLNVMRGLSHESIGIRFGQYLEHLWVRNRTFTGSLTYETYSTDVLATYADTVFERNGNNIVLTWNVTTSEYDYNVLHWKGEPILNTTGDTALSDWLIANPTSTTDIWDWVFSLSKADQQLYITNIDNIQIAPNSNDTPTLTGGGTTAYNNYVGINPTSPSDIWNWLATLTPTQLHDYSVIAHTAGSVILDAFGQPTIAGGGQRGLVRQFDIFMMDGLYYFATNPGTVTYRDDTIKFITEWITEDMVSLDDRLLEQTDVYLYPKNTVGKLRVQVGDNETAIVDSEQRLTVTYHVPEATYANPTQQEAMRQTTIRVLSEAIKERRVSHSGLVARLQTAMGDDAVSTVLTGFLSDNHRIVTMLDDSMRLTLGKVAVALSNTRVGVRDAVTVNFIKQV